MNRRWLITLIVCVLLAALYFSPRVPAVRQFVLDKALQSAGSAGFDIQYQKASGSLWSALSLEGLSIQSNGIDSHVDKLELHYNLWALLRRELPLTVSLEGVTGDLEVKALLDRPQANAPPIAVKLRALDLQDVALDLADVPFTLPELSLNELELGTKDGAQVFSVQLSTAEGSADVTGVMNLSPFSLNADVSHADVRLARRWWKGIDAGSAKGTVRVDANGVQADATFSDAGISFFNEQVTSISGTAQYQDGKVTTELQGQTLEGLANVTGLVDIAERQWSAEATGNIALAETLSWLTKNWLPASFKAVSLEGRSDATVSAFGWQTINLSGTTEGAGSLQGLALDDLKTELSFVSDEGFNLALTSLLANGPITASFRPKDQGFRVEAEGQNIQALANTSSSLSFALENNSGTLNANGKLDASGTLLSRNLTTNAALNLTNGIWSVKLNGQDDLGESLSGIFKLKDGNLEGNAELNNIQVPLTSEPLELSLSTNGALRSLPVSLNIKTPEQLKLSGFLLEEDFSGQLNATLEGVTLKNIQANLGALALSGNADLSKQDVLLEYNLSPVNISEPVQTEVSATAGILRFSPSGFEQNTKLLFTNLKGFGVALERLSGDLAFDQASGLSFISEEQGVNAQLQNGQVDLALTTTDLSIFNQAWQASGTTALALNTPLEDILFDVTANSALGEFALKSQEDRIMFDATTAYGELQGGYDAISQNLTAQGDLLGLPLNAEGLVSLNATELSLTLNNELTGSLQGALTAPTLELTGDLSLADMAARFNLPVTGNLDTNLTLTTSGLEGKAEFLAEFAGVPINATLLPSGWAIDFAGNAQPYGIQTELSGSLLPSLSLAASTAYGDVNTQYNVASQQLSAQGQAFGMPISAQGQLSAKASSLNLLINNELTATLQGDLVNPNIALTGLLTSNALAQWFNLPLNASLASDLALTRAGATGTLELVGDVANIPVDLSFIPNGWNVNLEGSAEPYGVTTKLSGSLLPAIAIAAEADYGTLTTSYSFDTKQLTSKGDVLGLALQLAGELSAQSADLSLNLNNELNGHLQGSLSEPEFYLVGDLNLNELATSYNVPFEGNLATDLLVTREGVAGSLSVAGQLPNTPLQLDLAPEGWLLALSGQAEPFGEAITLSGDLLPELKVTAEHSYGQLTLEPAPNSTDFIVQGEGQTPLLSRLGYTLTEQNWQLSGSLQERQASLQLGQSNVVAELGEAGWQVVADLKQSILANDTTSLSLDASLSASQANPKGTIDGQLIINTASEPSSLLLSGSLASLDLTGTIAANSLSDLSRLPLDLAGTLELKANLEPLALNYQADALWSVPNIAPVNLAVTGQRGRINASLLTETLNASYENNSLFVKALEFDLRPFVLGRSDLPAVTLTGDLSYEDLRLWQGELLLGNAQLSPGEARLVGNGESLSLEAKLTRFGSDLNLQGKLLPELAMTLDVDLASYAQLNASLSGSLSKPVANATLSTQAFMWDVLEASLPAQTVEISSDFRDGNLLSLLGDSLSAEVSANTWSGELNLPFIVQGETHSLNATLFGALTQPSLSGIVSGSYINGPLALTTRDLSATLELDLNATLNRFELAAFEASSAVLELSAKRDLSWQASLSATSLYQVLPLAFEGSATGQASNYSINGNVFIEANAIPFALTSDQEGTQLNAELIDFDLIQLQPLVPIDLTGLANGRLSWQSQLEHPLSLELSADGRLQAQPLALSARFSEGRLAAQGELAELGFEASADTLKQVLLSLNYRNERLPSSLKAVLNTGLLAAGEAFSFNASGQVASDDLALTASFNPETRVGQWQANLAQSSWQGDLRYEADAWRVDTTVTKDANLLIPQPLELTAQLSYADSLVLEALNAKSMTNNVPLALDLSGELFPATSLHGNARADGFDFLVGLATSTQENSRYEAKLRYQDLLLKAQLGSLTTLNSLNLSGEASVEQPLSASLNSELYWQQGQGFSGSAQLSATQAQHLSANISMTGNNALELTGQLSALDAFSANLNAKLAPNIFDDLSGSVTLSGDLTRFIPNLEQLNIAQSAAQLELSSQLALSGTVLKPELVGPVALAGGLEAQGSIELTSAQGTLTLANDNLEARAFLLPTGWQLSVLSEGQDLSPLVTQVKSLRLDSILLAEQRWGEALSIRSDDFVLSSEASVISGNFSFEESLQGRFDADLVLSDLVALPLSGRVQGELVLLAQSEQVLPVLSATLNASELRFTNSDAFLDGTIIATGALSKPSITARLTGGGSASGQLLALLEPDSARYTLSSDLSVGQFRSNIDLLAREANWQATGTMSYAQFGLAFNPATQQNRLELLGYDALNNWLLGFNTSEQAITLSGPLNTFFTPLDGQMSLRANWENRGLAWLTGNIQDAAFGSISLGDALIVSENWQSRNVSLEGTLFSAQASLKDDFAWQLDRLELALTDSTKLSASGSGDRSEGSLEAQLDALLSGENLALPLSASYASGNYQINSDTALGSGRFVLNASARDSWSGTLNVQDVQLADSLINLDGNISGELNNPLLNATSKLELASNELSGTIALSREGFSLAQSLLNPQLTAVQPDEPLQLAGSIWPKLDAVLSYQQDSLSLNSENGGLALEGALELETSNYRARIADSENYSLELELSAKQLSNANLSVGLENALSLDSLAEPLSFVGLANSSGQLRLSLSPNLSLEANAFSWQSPYGDLNLWGSAGRQDGWQAELNGSFEATSTVPEQTPWLTELETQPFSLSLQQSQLELISESQTAQLNLKGNLSEQSFSANAQLSTTAAQLSADLTYAPSTGPNGSITANSIPLYVLRNQILLSGNAQITPSSLVLGGNARLGTGLVTLSGTYGLANFLPKSVAPQGLKTRLINARLVNLDLQTIPFLNARLPFLTGSLGGIAQLNQNRLVSRLVSPNLSTPSKALPLSLTLNGPLDALELTGSVGRSQLTATLNANEAEGLLRLDQFPIQTPAEAAFGATDLEADLTGILRFDVPFRQLGQSDVRFASEQFVLERSSVVTTGNLSFSYQNERFVLSPSQFSGLGSWQAEGVIANDELALNFNASEADFSPLLALIPQLSIFDLELFGDLNLNATGSLASPNIQVLSKRLDLSLSSTKYTLNELQASLVNKQFSAQSQVNALSPLQGQLELTGSGSIDFLPSFLAQLNFNAQGNATIPSLGDATDLNATLSYQTGDKWQLSTTGKLGNPFSITGQLAPLELTATGRGLNIRAPQYFLLSSETDVDLLLKREDRRFVLGGTVNAAQANLSAAERQPRQAASPNRQRPRVLNLIEFDDVRITAPQELSFNATVGNAELGLDVTLSGTAAAPELEGQAQSLRGSFRFAGRTFNLSEGIANFQASRGIYPTLNIRAQSNFSQADVTRGQNISFVEPTGQTFAILLSLTGEVERVVNGPRAFNISLDPQLSSDAIIQDATGIRGFSENDLYSLLTLGRINTTSTTATNDDPNDLVGEGSVTQSIAQGAIDTAVDILLLSELQKQLAEALGLDIFEIRTTPLSTLITGSDAAFGVALRVGGYLSEEVFASYEISNLSLDSEILLTNEFNLRYQLLPVELGITGRLDVLNDNSTIPALGFTLGYAINPLIRLELGADVSNAAQSVSFGVSFRW